MLVIFSVFQGQKKPTCVQWSPLVQDLIISGDDRGTIVLWWLNTDGHRSLQPENAHIFTLACSPHDPNLLAIGSVSTQNHLID
jgi:gem associated protein 5